MHTFYAKPGDAVNLIEALAIDATGYDAEYVNGRLTFKGTSLSNASLQIDTDGTFPRIVHDDTLEMATTIHIIDLDGTRHSYEVGPQHLVSEIEDMLLADTGYDASEVRGKLIHSDDFLRSGTNSLSFKNVYHDDVLYLPGTLCPAEKDLLSCPQKSEKACGKAPRCKYCASKCVAVVSAVDPICEVPNSLYAHCTKMRVHIVDLQGKKYTYLVDPGVELKELRELSADDASIAVENVFLKDENDNVFKKYTKSLSDLSIKDEDTLYMYYFIHVVDFAGKSTHSASNQTRL